MRWMAFVMLAAALAAQDNDKDKKRTPNATDCPLHAEHMAPQKDKDKDQRFQEMNARGNVSMGFDQEKTTHHFRPAADGGAIEVTVNDANDSANLTAIRKHLKQVAADFSRGNFTSPLATHGELPAGAAEMQSLKGRIAYRYEELPAGARVHISTRDAAALKAVQQFLGYQVKEHRTGDAPEHKH
jgi:hypothetical protein